jgi:hypothetical protein
VAFSYDIKKVPFVFISCFTLPHVKGLPLPSGTGLSGGLWKVTGGSGKWTAAEVEYIVTFVFNPIKKGLVTVLDSFVNNTVAYRAVITGAMNVTDA